MRIRALMVVVVMVMAACGPTARHAAPCTADLTAGDLVITEVFADSAGGADEGKEWFEIYNNTNQPLELEGVTLTASRPDGSSPQTHAMREQTIGPGAYLALGNAAPDALPPYVGYGYGTDLGSLFNTGGGELAVACGDTLVDSVQYDGVKPGHSREFTDAALPDASLDDDPANWCDAADAEFADGNYGTPGAENDCQPAVVGACSDGGTMRGAIAPGVGDLVITEVMPKPKAVSATAGQWFEIEALRDIDLNGVGLDRANDAAPPEVLTSGACIHMAQGSFAVFARSSDATANGGLDALGTFSFSIDPVADADLQLVYGDLVLDQVTWASAPSGASLQLDPSATDPASNDDPANFCAATVAYDGSDRGTPGAANTSCASAPPVGQCTDDGTPRSIAPPSLGQLAISELLPNAAGTGTDPSQEWFEIANIGDTPFDLNELGFQGNAETIEVLHAGDCKPVAPGGFALFAHSTDPSINGGLPAVDGTFSFALSTELSVYDGDLVLDHVELAAPLPKDGLSRQVTPEALASGERDGSASYCDATAAQVYGSANAGTPKAPNRCM